MDKGGDLTVPTNRGTYHFRAFVDSENITVEQSEMNNQNTVTYEFR
jgi:subtilase family serine protease